MEYANITFNGNRIVVPKKLAPSWEVDEKIQFSPLCWIREIYAPKEFKFGAWGLIHSFDDHEEWTNKILEIKERTENDLEAAYQLLLNQKNEIKKKDANSWNLTIPEFLRRSGAFPSKEVSELTGIQEKWGISVWSKETLKNYLINVNN